MIFPDSITVKITTRVYQGGGIYENVVTPRDVRGVATFLDSSTLLGPGSSLVNSRLRIVLSPAGDPIPAAGVALSWGRFPNLVVEGAIEPHYRRGRLHHYECVARSV